MKYIKKYFELKHAGCNVLIIAIRYLYYRLFYGLRILAHQNVTIRNPQRIKQGGMSVLYIGLGYRGFLFRNDKTLLNIQGKLMCDGSVQIERGCRIDVCKGGVLLLNDGVSINSNTKIICNHYIDIGQRTGISWDCQIMDNDWHKVEFKGKKKRDSMITIGEHVLVFGGCKIYKSDIADGCVIASDSIVKKSCLVENAMYAGNPAKLVKETVTWK